MKRTAITLAATLAMSHIAKSQTYHDLGSTIPAAVVPLVGCPTGGGTCAGPVSSTNPLPVSGTFSASLSGFAPGSAYATPLSVSTASSRVVLPAGTTIVVYNIGSNAAFVQLGGSSVTATTSADVIQPNSWMAFTVGSNTYLAAITSTGSAALNISGGAGLPTGAGGGGGGSGGGSVPTGSAGSPNSSVVTMQGISGGTPAPVTLSALPTLPSGSNTIGNIGNSSFAISGTLPAFASTPTVNLGAIGSAATDTHLTNVQSSPGTSASTAVTIQGSAGGVAIPISGTVSASIGGFAPGAVYAGPLSVSTTSANVALPSGNVVVVYNTGSNSAYVKLGTSGVTASASNDVIPAGGWMAFTVGTNTTLAAITSTGTTSLNLSGGAGIATGSGGGGGGSGGSVTIAGTLPAFASTPSVNAAQSGSWNIGNITGAVTLPTGAATATNQTNVQSAPGTSQTTALTVQGNASGIAVPVSASALPLPSGASTAALQTTGNTSLATIATNQPTNAAQGSTTSGQTGAFAMAAATTGAPTYSNGTTNPLSTDTNGNLRVTGSFAVSGYDSGIVRVTATPGSTSHAAGTSVGGLFSIPIARVNGGSGIISGIHAFTSWNSAATYVIRLWQKNPSNTTCADGSAFVGSNTDNAYLVTGPQALQFNAPLNTTGDANSYADLLALSIDYKNVDGAATSYIYACLVTNAADTPGASATLSVGLSGPQN